MIAYREVTPDDLELVGRHRHEMFKASGRTDEALAAMGAPFAAWLAPRLADGCYFGWIAEEEGAAVGGLGMMAIDWPPHPLHLTDDRRGYILNLFVEPSHRGRGIARRLMELATQEAQRRKLSYLILHATRMARPMYEAMGWRQTSEMGFALPLQGSEP